MIIPCCEISSCNTISWLFTELPDGIAEAGYNQQLYPLGITLPAIYTLISGSLPPGLTLSSTGVINGDLAVASEGEYEFSIQVHDAKGCASIQLFSLTVLPQMGFYTVSNAPLVMSTNDYEVSDRWPIT